MCETNRWEADLIFKSTSKVFIFKIKVCTFKYMMDSWWTWRWHHTWLSEAGFTHTQTRHSRRPSATQQWSVSPALVARLPHSLAHWVLWVLALLAEAGCRSLGSGNDAVIMTVKDPVNDGGRLRRHHGSTSDSSTALICLWIVCVCVTWDVRMCCASEETVWISCDFLRQCVQLAGSVQHVPAHRAAAASRQHPAQKRPHCSEPPKRIVFRLGIIFKAHQSLSSRGLCAWCSSAACAHSEWHGYQFHKIIQLS